MTHCALPRHHPDPLFMIHRRNSTPSDSPTLPLLRPKPPYPLHSQPFRALPPFPSFRIPPFDECLPHIPGCTPHSQMTCVPHQSRIGSDDLRGSPYPLIALTGYHPPQPGGPGCPTDDDRHPVLLPLYLTSLEYHPTIPSTPTRFLTFTYPYSNLSQEDPTPWNKYRPWLFLKLFLYFQTQPNASTATQVHTTTAPSSSCSLLIPLLLQSSHSHLLYILTRTLSVSTSLHSHLLVYISSC
eukprot:497384-Hanusia_phi.AAC.2